MPYLGISSSSSPPEASSSSQGQQTFSNVTLQAEDSSYNLHESYGGSHGRQAQNSDITIDVSKGSRPKNNVSLDRLHIQNLPSQRPLPSTQPKSRQRKDEEKGTVYRRADGQVLNPDKLRPTTSALTTSMCSTVEPGDCTSFSKVVKAIHQHYSRVDYVRSEAQLAKEAYLFGNVKFSRWIFLPAAFCFQAVCGTLYAWSVFNNLIDNALYNSGDGTPTTTHMAAITFYVALGCFGVSSSIMGPWLERNGPRKAGLLGAVLFLTGNLITAIGIHVKHISLVYFGYGVFGGLGLGISYISPVSALQKWFPDRRGVAAGLAVSGFGAGSIVMAKVPDPLSAAVGLPLTFVILGCFYFTVMVGCALVFRVPPPGYVVNGLDVWARRVHDVDNGETGSRTEADGSTTGLEGISIEQPIQFSEPGSTAPISTHNQDPLHTLHPLQHPGAPRISVDESPNSPVSPISATPTIVPSKRGSAITGRTDYDPCLSMSLMDAIHSREFRLMYIMFLANTMAGVVIISRLANITTDIFGYTKSDASTIVSINGGFNLVGRLAFASISDHIGRKNSYLLMLGSQVVILASMPIIMAANTKWAFLMAIWILTSCYGGGFGCIPAFLCDMFGPSNIGPLHGVILTSWSISSVGAGLLFTAVYNHLLKSGIYTIHDSYTYSVNMRWILASIVLGFCITLFVRTGIRDRLLPNVQGELFHIRIFGRITRFGRFGVRCMSTEEEQEAWTMYLMQRQLEDEQGQGLRHTSGIGSGKARTPDVKEKASQS